MTGLACAVSGPLLGAALIAPLAMPPVVLHAEDQAYRMWVKENHRKNTSFVKLKANDQQAYWGWRHDHSDALLKIEIR